MKIIWGWEKITRVKFVTTLGSFDGIHKGHQRLIENVIKTAKDKKLKSAIISFIPHPRKIIKGREDSLVLLPLEYRIKFFEMMGIDYLLLLDFNEEFSFLSPEKFIELLVDNICINYLIVGFNFRFGFNRRGGMKLLKKLGKEYGFSVKVQRQVKIKGELVNTTTLRKFIRTGNFNKAGSWLGRRYFISGEVEGGNRIGRKIGYNTANIRPDNEILPPMGVYACYIHLEKEKVIRKGVLNIGFSPTAEKKKFTIETFIFDFKKDIYGENIKIYPLKKIRNEKKFLDIKELSEQIEKDVQKTKKIMENLRFKEKESPFFNF